ncbi:MAG TPA: CHAT domain-containing protein [Ktedonobacterales bacterium]|jgi:CHAT domain-containing protein
MNAHTFVSGLLPLQGEAITRYFAEHAPAADDLDTIAQLLKDEAQAQETRDLEQSLIIADQLLAFADWTGSPRHRALGLLERGNVLMLQGHHREAIDCFDTAGADFLKAGDEIGWARTRISYLFCASRIGLAEQALQHVERAREVFLSHDEYGRAADLETNLAIALSGVGRYQEALAAYDRILLIISSRETGDMLSRKARVLTNKAFVLEMQGDLHGAITCLQEARAIFAAQQQLRAGAAADLNQAWLRASLGQYSAALHLYHQAREYYQQHAIPNALAAVNADMAHCLLRLNRPVEALKLAEEAVALCQTLDETSELGTMLVYLARAQAACNKPEAALLTLKEARRQFESVGNLPSAGLAILTVAELLIQSRDQLAQALESAKEAMSIFYAHHMEHLIAEAHLLQGRAYELSDNVVLAAELGNKALKEARQAHIPWLEFGCELLLGRLMQRQGNLEAAEQHYQAALTLLEGLMTWLVRDQRSTFLTDKEDVFSALISLSLKRSNPNRALEYLERMKSQVLREYLTRSSEIRLKASDPEEARLLQELQRLRQELHVSSAQVVLTEKTVQSSTLAEQAAAARGAPTDVIETEKAQQNTLLNQQKAEQRRREQAISELLERAYLQHESSRFTLFATGQGGHQAHSPLSIEHLSDLMPEGSVLLEYFTQGDDLLIFTLHARHRRTEITHVPGAANRISRMLPLFRTNVDLVAQHLMSQPAGANIDPMLTVNIQGLARRLYDLLLKPIEIHIPTDGRLIIVPYGLLHLLPFHALHSEVGYLIERCEVAYLPAAAMLALQESQRAALPRTSDGQGNILVLGHSHGGLLPHALHEAHSVAHLLGASPFLDEQATIERLSGAAGSYNIIHIAAHGQNRADAPDFSYLQLADGQLSMIDVFNLDLPAELITLSGCETGLVVIGGGDELLGLGRGFLYAGARSLLMSLWRVEDASTALLMERFYQGLLAGQSRAGALRGAQQALLADARAGKSPAAWQHPYFWAPFRLLGASDPVAL